MITTQEPAAANLARERGHHPLELIPLFRRWPPSLLRNLLYTAIWSSALALVLTVLQKLMGRSGMSFARLLFATLVISNLIGFMIHGMLELLERNFPRDKLWRFRAAQVLAIALASVIGIPFGNALVVGRSPLRFFQYTDTLTFLLAFALITAALMVMVLSAGERRMRRAAEMARQQEQIAAAGRLVAEARLRALQAQIEPHFLYNTLANVVSLIDSQPAQARRMLERFIDYLRASLAASRAEHATVGSELDLAGAYLDVLDVRMAGRLRWRIEAEPSVRALPMTPMLLQPLVENAIMHGIEPKLDGGEIVIRARLDGGMLCVEVADSGLGLRLAPPRPGGGLGLANLRERLRQLGGQVQLIENPEGGVTARLLLPSPTVTSSTIPAP
ncbi:MULTISPECIES: sensor histidine kinase [unclassified Massilia]|uniref:sensor histidine kinase n=1 Tax=unclassified Massilia TaxID=2609279 RepID=UPI001B810E24|nr:MULTISPECIES: histidine kinase [unclassified Massilia]MBQ5942994.1 histidine kinase [Massilia sp. AB1]MBQ5965392.1 histidine kinase [Massilia sp. ZL223]